MLVFLTGQDEIESVERLVHERARQLPEGSQKIMTVPIYSSLPSEQQMNVFKPAPSGSRKVNMMLFLHLMTHACLICLIKILKSSTSFGVLTDFEGINKS